MITRCIPQSLADRFSIAALAAMLVIAAATFGHYGVGADEWNTARYGDMSLRWYLTLGADTSSFDYFDLHYYGAGLYALMAALARLTPGDDGFAVRHGLGMLLGIVALAGTWRLGRRLGGPWAGFAALLLLALLPYFWGQMAVLPVDVPFAALMTWALIAMLRYGDELAKPRLSSVLLVALMSGLAAGLRVGALPILVANFAAVVIGFAVVERVALRPLLLRLLWQGPLILVIVWIVMLLCWPWGLVDPFAHPLEAATHFKKLPINFPFPFWGEQVRTTDLPWTFIPGYLLAKLPFFFLAGIFAIPLAASLKRRAPDGNRRFAPAFAAIACAFAFAPFAAIVTHATFYDGIRHFLFILPPLAALAGFAVVEVARSHVIARMAVMLAAAASVLLTLRAMIDLYPYEYIWFNELAGGVHGTVDRFEQDYWVLDESELVDRLRVKLRAEGTEMAPHRYKVCVWWNDISQIVPSTWIKTEGDAPTEFVIAPQRFPCAPKDAKAIVTVVRDGVELGRVADLRANP
ncbi:MAG TPA: hypothetical protein VGG27_00310 [Magnetospirillaceae bacterium]|jgi:4-amino-4-deoxy-L-arabinose transferase-like glycosyltransferase